MTLKKDKQKVLGEVFDDERIKGFLNYPAPAGISHDYHLLEKAYRGMKAENFATFVDFFLAAGYSLNTLGPEGKTLLQTVKQHRHGEPYVAILEKAGAQ
ncbi:PA4642 family protein [Gilvimarinus agarilyticus]|uniref:PA4642 family protein n=1 Tax=unclassified Gilvimarinus TaxID=2642066 RepID=UPI001C0841D5|nr:MULTISPECIES: PA4642 family protein [unclassified Gilvimarinus]MBU2885426.1 PA4642 family protein [Gilvimarinus agarilyticus]MDO6570326.1 PA4642 family protein [Gilvimarinus sp. 2_MG-2023]MDO6746887.1 PA4642 family protein [Gilvimarinus sp. 1_MG-2023]